MNQLKTKRTLRYKVKIFFIILLSLVQVQAALPPDVANEIEYLQAKHDLLRQKLAPIFLEATVINIDADESDRKIYHDKSIISYSEPTYDVILNVTLQINTIHRNNSVKKFYLKDVIHFQYTYTHYNRAIIGPRNYQSLKVKLNEELRFFLEVDDKSIYTLAGGVSSIERLDHILEEEFQAIKERHYSGISTKLWKQKYMVHFAYDKHILSQEEKSNIQTFFKEYKDYLLNDANLKLIGNSDRTGSDEYNFHNALIRAKSVKQYLVSLGMNPQKITIVSYGEIYPLCADLTLECQAMNRRVEFQFE